MKRHKLQNETCPKCGKGKLIFRWAETSSITHIRVEHYICDKCRHDETFEIDLEDQRFERLRKTFDHEAYFKVIKKAFRDAYKDKCRDTFVRSYERED